jgi:glycosyltransferase involved in cell wall biosynthesis
MKVCIIGQNISVHIQKWIKAISMYEDIELHVITFDKGLKFENVNYHYIYSYTNSKLDYVLNLLNVKRILKKIKPDILHAHYATSCGLMAAFSGFHPFILTGWGADIFDSPKNFFMKLVLKNTIAKADEITVLSKITQRELSRLTTKSSFLIPFGVDTKLFTAKIDKNNDFIRIGTIRTLEEKYGIEYLIKAFAIINKKYPAICLDIVGDGPQRQFLEQLAKTLNVSEKVIFHGYINQNQNFEKYIKLFHSFDIFTILSIIDSETFGVAAVEASACGIPVVATNVGGLPEVVDDGVTGIIVAPQNAEEIAIALEKLILSKELRQNMGKKGREKVENLYNWHNNVQQMINLYRKVLNLEK